MANKHDSSEQHVAMLHCESSLKSAVVIRLFTGGETDNAHITDYDQTLPLTIYRLTLSLALTTRPAPLSRSLGCHRAPV